jgi:hypothetical protein
MGLSTVPTQYCYLNNLFYFSIAGVVFCTTPAFLFLFRQYTFKIALSPLLLPTQKKGLKQYGTTNSFQGSLTRSDE